MHVALFMLTENDEELLGVANRPDVMGVLAVWSSRARDLVPTSPEHVPQRLVQQLARQVDAWKLALTGSQ